LTQTEKERLLHLADTLHQRVVGQDEAVDSVAEAVLRSRAGLARLAAPTGSFLFLGPTGVGKTELAKALAFELFDSEKTMVSQYALLNFWCIIASGFPLELFHIFFFFVSDLFIASCVV